MKSSKEGFVQAYNGQAAVDAHRHVIVAQMLTNQLPARFEGGSMILHLFGVPATANPEYHAAVGGQVNACYFLGEDNRVAFNYQADAGG